jgi:CRP-like cAMP-binding protein
MYLVCDGDVWLSLAKDGWSAFGRRVQRGSLIGMAAAMAASEHRLTAEAISEVQLGFISREVLANLMTDATVAYELVRLLSIEVRALHERLVLGSSGKRRDTEP